MYRAGCIGVTADRFWEQTPAELARCARVNAWRSQRDLDNLITQAWLAERFHRERTLKTLDQYLMNKGQEEPDIKTMEHRHAEHERLVEELSRKS